MSTMAEIIAERQSWGDPVDVILNDNVNYRNKPLHRVVYDNGKFEYFPNEHVHQCSWNAGGDPASGCDTFTNPHATDGLCAQHRAAYAALTGDQP